MHGDRVVRRLRALLFLVPLSVATAQVGPPPPPPPLGPPPSPPGNPVTAAKASLGKALFWDEQLSSTRTVACGSCHQGRSGGSDPRSAGAPARAVNPGNDGLRGTPDDVIGSPGVPLSAASGAYVWNDAYGLGEQVTPRLTNSHINAGYSPRLFWDGRATPAFLDPVTGDTVLFAGGALESQAAGPPVSSVEMGHIGRDWNDVAARVAQSRPLALATFVPPALAAWIAGRGYPQLFAEAFGSPAVTPARIAMAIASYERTLFSNRTPFDTLLAGNPQALTPQENAGRQLFVTLPCGGCHGGSLLSDNLFHYIGESPAAEDSGFARVTGNPANLGMMRTPSLRNVALRPAYMHDGRFRTLEEVVDFYDRGGDFNAPNKAPGIAPLGLTPQQKASLVAFLRRPLTDPRVAAQSEPFDRPSLFSESELVPQVLGGAVAGSGAFLPAVTALEPPVTGNPSFTVGVSRALGGATAVLVIDAAEPPSGGGIPAGGSFARVPVALQGAGPGAGRGSASLAIPENPALEGQVLYGRWYVEDPGAPGGVAASPSFRFKVFGAGGAGVLAAGDPALPAPLGRALRLYAGRPNPFAASTAIRYEIFAASPVRLSIYDAQGRRVRALVREAVQLPGSYTVTWDGRDDGGRSLPGGVYFYRLDAGASSESRRSLKLD